MYEEEEEGELGGEEGGEGGEGIIVLRLFLLVWLHPHIPRESQVTMPRAGVACGEGAHSAKHPCGILPEILSGRCL